MCGVFGFVGESLNLRTLKRLATETERRGRHAFGFAWVDQADRIHAYRQAGKVSDHLGLLAMARGAKMLIGHCRFATDGDPSDNVNNHPHPCDGGWLVHNGVVANADALVADHELVLQSECDSEVLAALTERADGDHVERCIRAAMEAQPDPLVTLTLWPRPARLVMVRRVNPLHWTQTKGGFYLASLSAGLATPRAEVTDYTATEFRFRKGHPKATMFGF